MDNPEPPPSDRLIKLDEVMKRTGISKSFIYKQIKDGTFPPPYKLSPFAARWSEAELSEWIDRVKGGLVGRW